MKALQKAIDKGIGFLGKDQQKDGSFICLVSTKLDDYSRAKVVPAIVPTNIVLSSLITDKSPLSLSIKKKAADFLISEKSAYWSFNYWFRKSDWFKKEPYPDDLDDTFCALAALYEYKPEIFDGEVMAKIVTMLTSAEKQEGGPYDMWLVPPEGRKTWDDTDLVVNSNIAFFLFLQEISLPKVNAFIEKSIDENDYEFPYNRIYPGLYFISRFYKGRKTDQMIKLILSKQEKNGKWENPLRTALAISSLINFSSNKYHAELEKGIQYLLKTQARDGSWEAASFYFQMRTDKKTLYAGSSSITTALSLEAIDKFKSQIAYPILSSRENIKINSSPDANKIYDAAVRLVRKRYSACGGELKKEAAKVIAKTLKGDKDGQIVLLPYFFKLSLGKLGKNISGGLMAKLGAANTLGWIAYTIYDDFLDGEGDTKLLSVANIALRESSAIFHTVLGPENLFGEFSKKIFDVIDSANAWEISNSRFDPRAPNPKHPLPDYGDYSQLAMKSFGHSLGPIAILFSLGHYENSEGVKNIMQFFKHYIIARQLDDDAHDWEDDLQKGHINAVTAQIFKEPKAVGSSPEELQRIFWEKTIVRVCGKILSHVEIAKKTIKKSPIIKDSAIFERLLTPIENSAKKALKERAETLKFLKTYQLSQK